MEQQVFEAFSKIVYEKSGIVLNAGKEALVAVRVGKRMRELGLTDHREYLALVNNDRTGDEVAKLLDHISTNVTSFFREIAHFDFMRARLREWRAEGQRRFRFWSAASSTGEEPYSMAMVVAEELGPGLDARILATDISQRVLEKCKEGVYDAQKTSPVPVDLRQRYFSIRGTGARAVYQVTKELQSLVVFKRLNLSEPPFPMKGPLDIVFCRNVMIYFDRDVRTRLVNEIYRLLRPGGFLFVGHTESLNGLATPFTSVCPAVYVKKS